MKPSSRLVVALSFALVPVLARSQQEHPNVSTGLKSENLFLATGGDNVNLYSGNLTYKIPLGVPLSAGPNLKLSATLVYNSSIWTNWLIEYMGGQGPEKISRPHPSGDRIFGTGWQLHFGRLIPGGTKDIFQNRARTGPTSPSTPQSDLMLDMFWAFVEPDGTTHEFYDRLVEGGAAPPGDCASISFRQGQPPGSHCYWYTHDTSFLRLDPRDPDHANAPTVYFPDGNVYEMGHQGGRYPVDGANFPDDDLDYAWYKDTWSAGKVTPPFDTTRIADPFGNAILVQYYGDAGAPPHPLDGYVASNEKESIPYRAYVAARPPTGGPGACTGGPAIEITASMVTESAWSKTFYIPRITTIQTPVYTSGALSPVPCASNQLSYTFRHLGSDVSFHRLMPLQLLTNVALPTGQQYVLGYDVTSDVAYMGGPAGRLTSMTLPTQGTLAYTYTSGPGCPFGNENFYFPQPELCSTVNPPPGGCGVFGREPATTICSRTTTRSVNGSPQQATTAYVRSYAGAPCDASHPENCRLRVDVWEPPSTTDTSQYVRVSRNFFWEIGDGVKGSRYGRPFQTNEYFLPRGTPSSGTLDTASPFRATAFIYEADVWDLAGGYSGFNHNTREVRRIVYMGGRTLTTDHLAPDLSTTWDGYGHLGLTKIIEDDGATARTLREVRECHLTSNANAATGCPGSQSASGSWILNPVTSRATSRPSASGDPAGANLSSTERFSIDPSTGFTLGRTVNPQADESDGVDHRVLTASWTKGTGTTGPCIVGAPPTPECANAGFPTSETTQLTGARLFAGIWEPSGVQTFTRNFFYKYGTLAAAYDSGTSFYSIDRDIAITGQVAGERDSSGRVSLTDQPPALTTTYEYDQLGRITKRTPPEEGPETTSYGTQSILRKKCLDAGCNSVASISKVFFDGLGRPIVQLRSMPGTNAWSYQVETLDEAGRSVATSEWQSATCSHSDPCDAGDTTNLTSKQATIDAGHAATPAGTVVWGFDNFGRPTNTRKADGAVITDSYTGWWQQVNTRGVATSPPSNVSYTYGHDALGRLTFVTEPATTQADTGNPQNPQRTTSYTYDHADRLISAAGTGTNSDAQNPVLQVRARYYDDFGWLVSEQTPEVPNYEVRARDGRGNPTIECTGSMIACASNNYDTTRDRIARTYDGAGRLLSSTRDTDYRWASPPNRLDGKATFEELTYDGYTGFGSLNLGRSNGRLVYAVRQNLALTNNEGSFFGWFANQDLYHYNGVGGRLSFRQTNSLLLDGPPVPESSVAPHSLAAAPVKVALNKALIQYFRSVGRAYSRLEDSLSTATADPRASGSHLTGGRQALDAWNPHGWFRWSFDYDGAGRLMTLTYPRRDEGLATAVTYTYDRGWLTNAAATLRDPFSPGGTASVDLLYNASGTTYQTQVSSSGSRVFKLVTPDDGSGIARPGAYWLYRTPSDIPWEFAGYSYDGSGNVTSFATHQYTYDARSRLTKADYGGTAEYRRYDDFGNPTFQTYPYRLFYPDRNTNRHSPPDPNPATREYDPDRGYLTYDSRHYVGRDFYADGGVLSEYGRQAPSFGVVRDISLYLLGADKERLLTFNGEDGRCDTELFRHTLRDPSGRVLTDYKADHQAYCDCSQQYACQWNDRFERDYVWLGDKALAILDRQQAPRFDVLDHLGSPRHAANGAGGPLGDRVFQPFGEELGTAGTMPERVRFTGHERNHVTGTDGQFLAISDYMHARNYVPMLGRVVTPDSHRAFSLFDPESSNRYTYVMNNPASRTDPLGFFPVGLDAITAEEHVSAPDPAKEAFERFLTWLYIRSFTSATQLQKATTAAQGFLTNNPLHNTLRANAELTCANDEPLACHLFSTWAELVPQNFLGPKGLLLTMSFAPQNVPNPTRITGYTLEGINQAISRDAGRGVATRAILDAVRNPTRIDLQARGARRFVGKDATVVLNAEGKVITAWATNSAGWRNQP